VAGVSLSLPDQTQRWRCAGCGNLTRFDVTRARRTTEFWHFDLAGEHVVEDTEVREETVEQVSCRWCGRADAIEVVSRAEHPGDQGPDTP
jgi:4-hydroxy-3-methylbut-2-en-1-yl diphosphate synthase IspG/GcpE